MAARVLLLSILFTEVLKPACAAGGGGSRGEDGPKTDCLEIDQAEFQGLTLESQPRNVTLGRKGFTLSCSAGPNISNICNISWLHNGVPLPPCESTHCPQQRNGFLQLHKKRNFQMVQKDGGRVNNSSNRAQIEGEYRCIAHSISGGSLRSTPSFVHIAELSHVFEPSPKNLTVQEGEVVRLTCLINSIPFPPNITWQRDGKTISPVHNNTKYSMVSPGVLYISATKPSDAGSYRCIATNEFLKKKNERSKKTKLTVVPKSDGEESYAPAVLFPQTSYHYQPLNGSNLELVCAAAGYPSPLIIWTFIPRNAGGNSTKQLLHNSTGIGILSLNSVSIKDAGIYQCSAKDLVKGTLKIQDIITVDVLVPPSFVKKPTSRMCPNGRTARFECQAQGVPEPRIYWLKDSSDVTINVRSRIYPKENNEMHLAISATVPSDSGIYQCVAVNNAGEIWAAGRLQVNMSQNRPAPPTSLKCNASSPVKIVISWKTPKPQPFSVIQAYTVHYRPVDDGKEEVSTPVQGNSTSAEVTRFLEPFTNYSIYIRAWNHNEPSDPSAAIVCSTPPSVPKAAPKINLDVISSTKMNVSWLPLKKTEARGVVVEYKLQWKFQDKYSNISHIPNTTTHYILTGLTPGKQYSIRVLARTEQGWPNNSETQFSWRTVTLPSTNQSTLTNIVDAGFTNVNASIIKVKWKMHENLTSNKPVFDSWKVYHQNEEGKQFPIILPRNTTEHSFTGLEANVSHIMGLCMMKSNEIIGCEIKQMGNEQQGVGVAPIGLAAVPVSPTSINVTWTGSTSDMAEYELCYNIIGHTTFEALNCFVISDNKAIVRNLKPYTLYNFKVRKLLNSGGHSSPYSETIPSYTDEDVPGTVEEVRWSPLNSTNVRIFWEQPNGSNGRIRVYFVAYTMNHSAPMTKWSNISVPGNKTSADLLGLVPGELYTVVVQAATGAGSGKPSNPIKVMTKSTKESDQTVGVILGVSISMCCIGICLSSIYCRKRCESSRLLRTRPQPSKERVLLRNGNGCCVERISISNSQHVNTGVAPNEMELGVLCPSTPVTTNLHCGAKGGHSNGVLESCVKEPLLAPWDLNSDSKDLHITENPQYKRRNSIGSNQQQESGLDDTQLTTVNCTLINSSSSLNNNLECSGSTSSLQKTPSTSIPVLGPNG